MFFMPLTLHAAWLCGSESFLDGNLFFWAESLDPTQALFSYGVPPEQGTARQRAAKIPSHPGQLAISQLRTLLAEELPGLPLPSMAPATATIWLPSHSDAPLMRRGVLHADRQQSASGLSNWQVSGVLLDGFSALRFLSQLRRRQPGAESPGRLKLGNDLLYWSNAAKFALELLIDQQYVPSLQRSGSAGLQAIWQPTLLDDRVQQRFVELVGTMPAACRAYNLEDVDAALSADSVTERFVAALVDAAIRRWSQSVVGSGGSPVLRWVSQLHAPDRQLTLPPQPAFQFVQVWQEWIEQLHITSDINFRIAFELVEPLLSVEPEGAASQPEVAGAADLWTLAYYLQARDEPRVLISARQVWLAQNGQLRSGSRRVDRPQERLLAGLGAASRLFAPIERSLRSSRPQGVDLTSAEAHRFLREAAPLLESNGFGVLLPEWWRSQQRARLGLRLRLMAADRATGASGLQVRFVWELTLGTEQLSQAELEALSAHRVPLLRLHDRWIEFDPRQVQAARQFLQGRQSAGTMSLLQSLRMAQVYLDPAAGEDLASFLLTAETADRPALGASAQLPVDAVDVDGWLQQVFDQLRTQTLAGELAEPAGFVGELRPYQRRGVGWLAYLRRLGLGACLADDMGLGKTVQAIALLLARPLEKLAAVGPALLVCPTSLVANWRREVERFAPAFKTLVHHGSGRLAGTAFAEAVEASDLVITSYGTARRDIDLLRPLVWSDLILDEAQNIKNPGAKQSQAVRWLVAQNRVALTGTPVENHLNELWSVFEFLNPGYLGSHEAFRQRFLIPIERYNDEQRTQELRRLVQPFLLRRLKSDPSIISDLPEKNEMVVYCSLTSEQAALYEATVHAALATLDQADGIQRRGLVLALLTRLKQICNHPAQFLKEEEPLRQRSGKLERLTEMLEEALSVGDHALIFTQFVEMGTLLQRHLRGELQCEVLFLHGGISATQRDQMVQSFQSDDGPPIFVLSLRAGGFGLNLTRANHVFHFDRWWNPAVENQATDRAFRIGQRRNVQVHKFVVAGTLEERIHALLASKQSLAESIVGSGEAWLTELNTEELRELLMLRREVLDD